MSLMGSQTKPSDSDNHGIFDGISVSLFPGWQQRAKAALHAVKRKGHKKIPKMPSPLAGRITGKYLFHVIDEKPAKDGVNADPANRIFTEKQKEDQSNLYYWIVSKQATSSPLHAVLWTFSPENYADAGTRAWKYIDELFQSHLEETVGLKAVQFSNIKQKEMGLDEYAMELTSRNAELQQLQRPIEDVTAVNYALNGISQKHSSFATIWRTTIAERRRNGLYEDGMRTGLSDLCQAMRQEDAAIKARDDADGKHVGATKKETGKAQLQAMIAEMGNTLGISKRKQHAFLTQLVKKGGKGGVQKHKNRKNKHCGLMNDLGHPQDTIVCDIDNSASVTMAMNDIGMSSRKSRHASVRKAYVREGVRNRITAMRHVKGSDNTSDVFTKALTWSSFSQHRASLLGRESDDSHSSAKRTRFT